MWKSKGATIALAGLVLATGCSDAGAPSPGTADGDTIVLNHFTMIDGTGAGPVKNAALIMAGGRISWVGAASELEVPKGATVEDLSGKFVMPGIIDSHVHLGAMKGLKQDTQYYTADTIRSQLRLYAAYGVTAVQSLGTDQDAAFAVRAAERNGRPDMARVFTAGLGVVYDHGYGGLPGLPQRVNTEEEARALVDSQKTKGADLIKLWMDDEFGDIPKLMPYSISTAVIDQAHEDGLKAVAHVFYRDNARELVNEGLDGFAHEIRDKPVGAAFIAAMKQHGTWQMAATLSREASFTYAKLPFLDDPFFSRGVTPQVLSELKSDAYQKKLAAAPHAAQYPGVLRTAMENFSREVKGGVRYGMGTDSGLSRRYIGYFAHWELALMVQAGLTPLQALTAATGSNAEFIGAHDLGTIAPGKQADLLVLDKSPLEDIMNTRSIHQVFIAGHSVPTIWQICVGRPADACDRATKGGDAARTQ
jgi:imidazolonepropionase-like amidohydrolase